MDFKYLVSIITAKYWQGFMNMSSRSRSKYTCKYICVNLYEKLFSTFPYVSSLANPSPYRKFFSCSLRRPLLCKIHLSLKTFSDIFYSNIFTVKYIQNWTPKKGPKNNKIVKCWGCTWAVMVSASHHPHPIASWSHIDCHTSSLAEEREKKLPMTRYNHFTRWFSCMTDISNWDWRKRWHGTSDPRSTTLITYKGKKKKENGKFNNLTLMIKILIYEGQGQIWRS